METERRRQILLGALAVVLAIAAYEAWPRTSAPAATTSKQTTPPASAARGGGGTSAGNPTANAQKNAEAASGAPDVHLEALSADRPKPSSTDRNLFRFKPKAPPPQPVPMQVPVPVPTPNAAATGPAGPPPPPPITLKCIGIIDPGEGKGPKIAVLTDNTGGPPLSAAEGGVVAGRYRILKIGVESIEMAYLDGRGRQTIRVSGS